MNGTPPLPPLLGWLGGQSSRHDSKASLMPPDAAALEFDLFQYDNVI